MRHNGGDPNLNSQEYGHLLRTLFQGKWRFRVLQEMIAGPVRLSQLRRAIPGCSKKVLIDTLRGLEETGWVKRREYDSRLRKVEYSITGEWSAPLRELVTSISAQE